MVRGKTTVTLENHVFSAFMVEYRYTLDKKLLNSWMGKRMTGFRLNWYLKDNNGSLITEMKPSIVTDWKSHPAAPNYQEQQLIKMVQLAQQARRQNIDKEEITRRTVFEKSKLILMGDITYASICSGGQIRSNNYSLIDRVNIGLID